MPVVALVGAAAAWGLGGAAAIGGVIAGTATLATTLTAVATIGATIGAVGAVTHDKTLSDIGLAMGAVGGIGSLAANAGLFGESATTASLFGTDPIPATVGAPDIAGEVQGISADDLASWAQTPTLPGVESAASATGAIGPSSLINQTGAVDAAAGLPTSGLDTATQAASGDANSLINGGGSGGAPGMKTLVGQNVDDATNQILKGTGGGTLPSGSPTDQASINAAGTGMSSTDAASAGLPAKGSYVGETATASDGTNVSWNGSAWSKQDGGFFSGLMKSPMAQYGVIQAAGSFLSGAFDPLKPAQVDALSAQAANNRAAAALTTQQTTNMQGKLPTASRIQAPAITGAPAPSGLINSAPATGMAA